VLLAITNMVDPIMISDFTLSNYSAQFLAQLLKAIF